MNPDKSAPLISYHTFMLPFRWDIFSQKVSTFNARKAKSIYDIPYEARLDVAAFKKALLAGRQGDRWKYEPFSLSTAGHYNEYTYFYPHARKAIFNTSDRFQDDSVTYTFTYNDPDCRFYNIYVERNDPHPISLEIEKISLKIYDTGIGILQFDLENHQYKEPEQILLINDVGRRIHPPFLGDFSGKDKGVFDPRQKSVYPKYIDICSNKPPNLPENKFNRDVDYYNNPTNLKPVGNQAVTILPEFIQKLLGEKFDTQKARLKTGDILLTPVIDDRMFVLCVYGDTRDCFQNHPEKITESAHDFWYRFVFIDGKDKGAANHQFENDLIGRHTYDRWMEYGTYYGISRYSFMTWIQGALKDPTPKMLLIHCKTMYYQMILLALAQRASIIRFSEEIAHVSNLYEKEPGNKDLEAIRDLYRHYILFVNKVYFNEVTAQEQGIEMYAMIQDHMRIKENLADLRQEIGELHTYADLAYEKKRGKTADILTVMAAFFVIPTFITGFFGMNIFGENFFQQYHDNLLGSLLQHQVLGYLVYGTLYVLFALFLLFFVFYLARNNKTLLKKAKTLF